MFTVYKTTIVRPKTFKEITWSITTAHALACFLMVLTSVSTQVSTRFPRFWKALTARLEERDAGR